MIHARILERYVFREVATSFLFCFAVFLAAGLIAGFLPLLQRGMETGMGLTIILFQVLINALPGALVTVMPLSMTIGILLGLGRMSGDNEIAALKSSGVSILRLAPPVIGLGIICAGLSLACTLILIPRGISEGRRLTYEAVTSHVGATIEERTIFDKFPNVIIYVESIDPGDGILSNVFIEDSSKPTEIRSILARKGRIAADSQRQALVMDLKEGTILTSNEQGESIGNVVFESSRFKFPLPAPNDALTEKSLEEMSIAGILERIEEARRKEKTCPPEHKEYYQRTRRLAWMIITQRFTHPMACVALALTAFPLGVINMGKSRLNNVSVGLVAVFLYYAAVLTVERIARSGLAPPQVILPVTPILFSVVALYLIACVRRERIPFFMRKLRAILHAFRRRRG